MTYDPTSPEPNVGPYNHITAEAERCWTYVLGQVDPIVKQAIAHGVYTTLRMQREAGMIYPDDLDPEHLMHAAIVGVGPMCGYRGPCTATTRVSEVMCPKCRALLDNRPVVAWAER